MYRSLRSELTRSQRPAVLGGWLGLTALFAALMVGVIFQLVGSGTAPAAGPGVTFPTVDLLQSSEGIVAPLASASSMFGVVTLAFWAVLTATDYHTGFVRLLVAAQPRRVRLLAGKIGALVIWTAAATTVAVIVNMLIAPMIAPSSDLDLSSWGEDLPAVLGGAWVQLFLALLVWGSIGMVLATVTKSSAVAISIGAGWVLLIESVIGSVAEDVRDYLPGSTISALASGGNDSTSYGTALALGAAYVIVCLGLSFLTFSRRDITD